MSPMTKAHTATDKSIKQLTIQEEKNFDYTTIVDRLETVSWSKDSHPTGVVKPVYEHSTITDDGSISAYGPYY